MLTKIGARAWLQTVKSARAGSASDTRKATAVTRPGINLRAMAASLSFSALLRRFAPGYCAIGRATRNPTSLLRRDDSTAKRAAERKTPGSLAHDPPRTTREPHSPLVQAEPSDGAP